MTTLVKYPSGKLRCHLCFALQQGDSDRHFWWCNVVRSNRPDEAPTVVTMSEALA